MKYISKWVGGKFRQAKQLLSYFPESCSDYYEPFVGMGSVLLSYEPQTYLRGISEPQSSIFINDINKGVYLLWQCLSDETSFSYMKENLELLITQQNTRESYLFARDIYNNQKDESLDTQKEVGYNTALFLYLLNCGYNGLARYNSKDGFNTPFGSQTPNSKSILENLEEVHQYLKTQNLIITNNDIKDLEFDNLKPDSFMYLDPPYDETFNSYSKVKFDREYQVALADKVESLSCNWLMTNSGTEWIKDRYKQYQIIELSALRSVAPNSTSRKKASDVIIKNYGT